MKPELKSLNVVGVDCLVVVVKITLGLVHCCFLIESVI